MLQIMQPLHGAGASAKDPHCLCSADGQPAVGVRETPAFIRDARTEGSTEDSVQDRAYLLVLPLALRQVLVSPGYPGEYTIAFQSLQSGSIGAPLTFYVQSQVKSVEIIRNLSSKPMSSPSAVAGVVPRAVTEPIPEDVIVQFKDGNGQPLAGVQAIAIPATTLDGVPSSAVAMDAGKPLTGSGWSEVPFYQVCLPASANAFSRTSLFEHRVLPILIANCPG